jgi:ubiquinone/menaquinone biosynthesis C-methylase UbiE
LPRGGQGRPLVAVLEMIINVNEKEVPLMDLKELKSNWEEFGRQDPLWAVLTNPDKKGNKWNAKEFFVSGENEINSVFEYLEALNIHVSGRALDFGCGVGRLTQALCPYFQECYGIDIAESMITEAQKYNRFGDKCKYLVNESDNLNLFSDNYFDFVYTSIVLQHIREDYVKKYITEFLRILKLGGILIFDMPAEPLKFEPTAYKAEISPLCNYIGMEVGSKAVIPVKVKNISNSIWPGLAESGYKFVISLGNHWLDEKGRLIINDDGRINIPGNVGPGEGVELKLTVSAPDNPGNFILEFDMVLEGVSWFKERGLRTTKHLGLASGYHSRF